jgi:hypothetical protein
MNGTEYYFTSQEEFSERKIIIFYDFFFDIFAQASLIVTVLLKIGLPLAPLFESESLLFRQKYPTLSN